MKSILIVYKTKTGFTKKYADWINETIESQTITLDEINNIDMTKYNIIIYGGGIHAGRIQGLKNFKNKIINLNDKKIIVFATGAAAFNEEIILKLKADNFSANELNVINFFYFQSGINYEKMGLVDKTIMKTYYKVLEFKKNKTDIEDETFKAISKSYDHSDKDHIKPMIKYINQLNHSE